MIPYFSLQILTQLIITQTTMAHHLIKRGKIFIDIFHSQPLQLTFQTHRNIKSCLQIADAQKYYQQHIQANEKTALLEYFNRYPMSWHSRLSDKKLSFFLQIFKLTNLSSYEHQMKMSVILRMFQYMARDDRGQLNKQLKKQQKILEEIIKIKPFDCIHAVNFLILQKNLSNDVLMQHCIQTLKKTQTQVIFSIFYKIAPILVKRLNRQQWADLRRFKSFLDFICNDWLPKDRSFSQNLDSVMELAKLQLHKIGYRKIPPIIAQILSQAKQKYKELNFTILTVIFELFEYLPHNYQTSTMHLLLEQIKTRSSKNKNQVIHLHKLPYSKLTPSQIKQIYEYFVNKDNIDRYLLYVGNKSEVRYWFKETSIIRLIEQYHFSQNISKTKNFSIAIISTSLLLQHHSHNPPMLQKIITVFKQIGTSVLNQNNPRKIARLLPFSSILHLISINKQFQLNWTTQLFQDQFIKRQQDFVTSSKMGNVQQAIELFHNSSNLQIISCINSVVSRIAHLLAKFDFRHFTLYIIYLLKSHHSQKYIKTVDLLLSMLEPEDCPYFVQMYLMSQIKNHKTAVSIIEKILKKNRSFSVVSLFLAQNRSRVINHQGKIIRNVKAALDEIETTFNIQDFKDVGFTTITKVLSFCHQFYHIIPHFSKKALLLSLTYFDTYDNLPNEGIKEAVKYLSALVNLGTKEPLRPFLTQKLPKLVDKLYRIFNSPMLLKTKQLQIKWVIGLPLDADNTSLIVSQILQEMSIKKYVACNDAIFSLLKLNLYGVIQLSEVVYLKLSNILVQNIQNKDVVVKDLTDRLNFIQNKALLIKDKFPPFLKVLLSLLQNSSISSFSACQPFLSYVEKCHSQQLLQIALRKITKYEQPWQVVRTANIIKYFPSLNLSAVVQTYTQAITDHIQQLQGSILVQIAYILHLSKQKYPQNVESQLSTMTKKSQTYLLSSIQSTNKTTLHNDTKINRVGIITRIIKLLWISIKTNQLTNNSLELYLYLVKNKSLLQQIASNNNNKNGITPEYISYVALALSCHFQSELKEHSQSEISLKPPFMYQIYTLKQEVKTSITQQLQKKQVPEFKYIEQFQKSKTGYFLKYPFRNIQFSLWLKFHNKNYVMLIIDPRFFNNQQLNGKYTFIKNSIQIITQATVIPIFPNQPFQLIL